MASRAFAALLTVLAFVGFGSVPRALATDPTQLQDFCVADKLSAVFVNGFVCKDPKVVTANDFFFHVVPGAINAQGSAVTAVSVNELPGLNTLGISLVRIDFVAGGQNPPHTHPRATEVLILLQGTLLVGFVGSNQLNNQLFTKQLVEGDVFVFPQGLIHFQLNNGKIPAVAFAGLSSQNPGVITIANSVFGTKPPILDEILAKAFMIEKAQVDWIQAQFAAPPQAGGGMPGGGMPGGGMPGGGGIPGNGTGGGYPGVPGYP
ncbi:germin-like protein 4-1 [Phragmites australis]|uniref:germin-like protein 4-1 n=1 Tax=Phragmites australis TaxID=29695 RepID=UPI002D7A096B|nr:germin-like protein 4-1 [Phragmites australis]